MINTVGRLITFIQCFVFLTVSVPAQAECSKRLVYRAAPGGKPVPAQVVECDDPLPDPSDRLAACTATALSSDHYAACIEAAWAAERALERARARALLRRGASDAEITAKLGIEASAIDDALRSSADLTKPMPAPPQDVEAIE